MGHKAPIKKKKTKKAPPLPPVIHEPAQIKAARVLAYNHYRRGKRRRDGTITAAARIANVGTSTIYRWLEQDSFVQCIEEQKALLTTEAIEGVRGMFKGKPAACFWWLKIAHMEQYDEKYRSDLALMEKKIELQRLQNEAMAQGVAPIPVINYITLPPGIKPDDYDKEQLNGHSLNSEPH